MPRPVRDDGRPSARLVLIGEAPGRHEHARGLPFVGPSGMQLAAWWRRVGLARTDFYITNVYPYQPPGNKLELVARDELDAWVDLLHERLAALDDPYVIVPTGNTALRALMRRPVGDTQVKITKYRGSIGSYTDNRGRTIKVVPTIHPAAVFHTQSKSETGNSGRITKHCEQDWARIATEAMTRELNLPALEHFIAPTRSDMDWYLEDAHARAEVMSIDIETAPDRILCVGFAFEPGFSFTIPLRDERHWATKREQAYAHEIIRQLCLLPCEKVLQNGLFDTFWLERAEGIAITNYRWDLKAMHHALDPVDDHDLAYMQSKYTRIPYHKDEAKDPEKAAKYTSNFAALQTYCGIDNCVQRTLQPLLRAALVSAGRLDFYERCYPPLYRPLLDMMLGGIRTDRSRRRLRQTQLLADCIEIQDRLAAIAGEPLHATRDFSRTKLLKFLYETRKLPRQRDRHTGLTTTGEVALRRLANRFPAKCADVIGPILEHRRKLKVRSFFDDDAADPDGYMRCEYTMTTEAGRLASKRNPMRTGMNLQNVDREVRDTFLPDPGHLFLEADLSQAESRVVYVLSGDDQLIDLARRAPWEFDAHTYNASIIFKKPPERITKDERYFGKRTVHGAQRGLRGDKMAGELLKDGYTLTPEECQEMLDQYLREHPGLEGYFRGIRQQVLRHHSLTNSWGRVWDVRHEKLGDDLYRRAYSFLPQSEIADLLNQWGVRPLHACLKAPALGRLVAQVHDSVLVSCVPELAYEIATTLDRFLSCSRTYTAVTGDAVGLTIPVEFKIGLNWKGHHEFKRLPPPEEFQDAVRSLGVARAA